jgi:hypothetical protein
MSQGNRNASNNSSNDTEQSQPNCKDTTSFISITDCPANEVGMRLEAEKIFDVGVDFTQSRGMGRLTKSFEGGGTITVGKVELTRGSLDDVNSDDSRDFITVRLN